jgi:hypothetical protein
MAVPAVIDGLVCSELPAGHGGPHLVSVLRECRKSAKIRSVRESSGESRTRTLRGKKTWRRNIQRGLAFFFGRVRCAEGLSRS